MKAFIIASLLLGAIAAPLSAQVIAGWNFDAATISSTSTSFGPITADVGSGSASGQHAAAATAWSTVVGNASAKSFNSNNWAVGDFYQFQTSTAGKSGIAVSWDQTGSATGPKDFSLSYSTDGTTFTSFASYSILVNGTPNSPWTSGGSRNSAYTLSYDLSAITALDNSANVYFRLIDASTTALNGGTVATAGSDRVDNFTITAIPEPSTYALLSGLVGLSAAALRRRRAGWPPPFPQSIHQALCQTGHSLIYEIIFFTHNSWPTLRQAWQSHVWFTGIGQSLGHVHHGGHQPDLRGRGQYRFDVEKRFHRIA